jgi:hypothetical protein
MWQVTTERTFRKPNNRALLYALTVSTGCWWSLIFTSTKQRDAAVRYFIFLWCSSLNFYIKRLTTEHNIRSSSGSHSMHVINYINYEHNIILKYECRRCNAKSWELRAKGLEYSSPIKWLRVPARTNQDSLNKGSQQSNAFYNWSMSRHVIWLRVLQSSARTSSFQYITGVYFAV